MRFFSVVLFVLITGLAKAQPTADIIEYINNYKKLAMDEMQRAGVPAAVKLAQGIHETQAGKSDLVQKSNNHFGIKCKAVWTGDRVFHDDDSRGECFRKYGQAADSYKDHSDFLRSSDRYDFLFQLDPTDYKAWAYGLKRAGYATNPKYAPIIIKLIEDYNLEQYTLIAMGKILPSEEVVLQLPKPFTDLPITVIPVSDTAEAAAQPALQIPVTAVSYPTGEFTINNTRVIFAKQGTTLLSVAQQYDVSLSRLLEFNELSGQDVLKTDQLLYLQRKRKSGTNEFHIVAPGENLYDICQKEAIRLDVLLDYNHLQRSMQPAVGEKLYLQGTSPSRPKL
jgi:LysM repeat protein